MLGWVVQPRRLAWSRTCLAFPLLSFRINDLWWQYLTQLRRCSWRGWIADSEVGCDFPEYLLYGASGYLGLETGRIDGDNSSVRVWAGRRRPGWDHEMQGARWQSCWRKWWRRTWFLFHAPRKSPSASCAEMHGAFTTSAQISEYSTACGEGGFRRLLKPNWKL